MLAALEGHGVECNNEMAIGVLAFIHKFYCVVEGSMCMRIDLFGYVLIYYRGGIAVHQRLVGWLGEVDRTMGRKELIKFPARFASNDVRSHSLHYLKKQTQCATLWFRCLLEQSF